MSHMRTGLFYCGYVLVWSGLITAGGSLLGAIVFPIVGTLAGVDMPLRAMIWSGARQIGFLTFLWAFGIAVVMAFHRAYRRRHAQPPAASSPANDG